MKQILLVVTMKKSDQRLQESSGWMRHLTKATLIPANVVSSTT
jgi:hypothetical protein